MKSKVLALLLLAQVALMDSKDHFSVRPPLAGTSAGFDKLISRVDHFANTCSVLKRWMKR